MRGLLTQASQYWQQRSRREQYMLAAMVLVLGAALYYLLIWQPLASHRAKTLRQLPLLQVELQQVQALARQAAELKLQGEVAAMPAAQLQSLLQQQLAPLGASLQISAEGEHAVRVKGELSFVDWVGMQGSLASQQIHARTLSLRAAPTEGRVLLDVLLAHANGM